MAKMRTKVCTAPGCDKKPTCNWRDGVNCYCNVHYQRMHTRGVLHAPIRIPALPNPICAVDGCNKRCRSRNATYCETHYYRKRRGRAPDQDPVYRYRHKNAAGYTVLLKCKHPLSPPDGRLYEHRRVVYDTQGPECPDCFWCGEPLDWSKAVVDHLNEVKDDNSPDNLVVACNSCNRARGLMIPFIRSIRPEVLSKFIETLTLMREPVIR